MRGLYLLALFAFLPINANAADYVWSAYLDGFGGRTGSSPGSACSSVVSAYNSAGQDRDLSFDGAHMLNEANPHVFICDISSAKSNFQGSIEARRSGDACPAEKPNYNASTGTCEGDLEAERCSALSGTTTTVRLTGNTNDPNSIIKKSPGSNNFSTNTREFNAGGCSSDMGLATDSNSYCVFKADGRYTCNIRVGYDGTVSSEGSASLGEAADNPVADQSSDTTQECSTWVDDAEGRRHYTCNTTSNAFQDGTSTCERGEYNMYCHPSKPTAESENKVKDDRISEQTNSDGGKTTTTETTTTTTYCKTGACNTSTTNNTSVKVTNGAGEVVSESSSCQGDDCAGPGEGEGEGEGDGEFTAPGSQPLPNASDAMPQIGSEDDLTYADATTQYMERIEAAPIVAAVTNIAVPSGGSCNVGSVSLWGGSVSFNHFCTVAPDVLAGLRYIFLAIWAWAALRLLLTA